MRKSNFFIGKNDSPDQKLNFLKTSMVRRLHKHPDYNVSAAFSVFKKLNCECKSSVRKFDSFKWKIDNNFEHSQLTEIKALL